MSTACWPPQYLHDTTHYILRCFESLSPVTLLCTSRVFLAHESGKHLGLLAGKLCRISCHLNVRLELRRVGLLQPHQLYEEA